MASHTVNSPYCQLATFKSNTPHGHIYLTTGDKFTHPRHSQLTTDLLSTCPIALQTSHHLSMSVSSTTGTSFT